VVTGDAERAWPRRFGVQWVRLPVRAPRAWSREPFERMAERQASVSWNFVENGTRSEV